MHRSDQRPLRYRCDLLGRFEISGGRLDVRILDLSEVGAFVETSLDLKVGDRGVLALPLPGGDPWYAEVTVVRFGTAQRELRHARLSHLLVSCPGVDVTFDRIPDDEIERLRGFLELLDER
ncbi:MAG: PilZ domain-containing protein [Myxococcaceae bacterium]|nr:PilZ domain-containing protein [Myxococcaceae bacterium]